MWVHAGACFIENMFVLQYCISGDFSFCFKWGFFNTFVLSCLQFVWDSNVPESIIFSGLSWSHLQNDVILACFSAEILMFDLLDLSVMSQVFRIVSWLVYIVYSHCAVQWNWLLSWIVLWGISCRIHLLSTNIFLPWFCFALCDAVHFNCSLLYTVSIINDEPFIGGI